MATDRLFNQSQGEELLSILEQIRDGYNSVDSLFSKTSVNPIQNKVLTNAITDTIEILGGTAQKSYSIGQYFLANDGYYYVATAAITAGSSNISTGASGNCSKTTIAAGMNNLTSQISNLNSNLPSGNTDTYFTITNLSSFTVPKSMFYTLSVSFGAGTTNGYIYIYTTNANLPICTIIGGTGRYTSMCYLKAGITYNIQKTSTGIESARLLY